MYKLHSFFRSSSSHRLRIALNLKGVPYETLPVNIRAGAHHDASYVSVNPQRAVPALGVGEAALSQSLAIIEWLEEEHPAPALLPEGSVERALVRSASQLISCDIQPLQNLRVLNYLRGEFVASEEQVFGWCRHWIGAGLAAFEAMVVECGPNNSFAFGNAPSMADACLIPQLFSAARFGVDLSDLPRIQAIGARCGPIEAFENALPANQPDADPA